MWANREDQSDVQLSLHLCAGIAAVILSSNQNLAPVQVLHTLLRHSVSGSISVPSLSDTHRLITPNLVAALPTDSSGK